jgi:hypothetical protein
MRKLSMVCMIMVIALSAGQAFAQATYLVEGSAGSLVLNLTVGACVTDTIAVDGSSFGTSPLVSGGFLISQSDSGATVAITSCQCYDGTLTPAVWDAGVTPVFDPTGYPGGVFVAAANLGAGVALPNANILVCDVTFCGVAADTSIITVDTVPDFDTWVDQNSVVYDSTIAAVTLNALVLGDPCECAIAGPASVQAPKTGSVTENYMAAGDAQCDNPSVYAYSTDCAGGTIDPDAGVFTVLAGAAHETCTVTATDTANTNINTGDVVVCTLPIEILAFVPPPECAVQIALGRSCPGVAIDDPAFNRPGRRGLAATCGEIIDFTVCSDCPEFDPACLVWDVPATLGTIAQIDDCCWRLTVGSICDQLDKFATFVVTVTDICHGDTADSVEIDLGKVIVDIGETIVQPNTESATVDINLTNLDHSVRAVSLDVAACNGEDNLVCTQCIIDPDRTLYFTCSAHEQADGSCRVVLYTTNPSALITEGRGTIAQIVYTAGPDLETCGADACIDLCPVNISVLDQFNEDLCPCPSPGEVCFRTCGDMYPQDCIGGTCGAATCCGDGMIDLFDILEAVDIMLNLQTATLCQLGNGDVPNGMPPYCGNPPGTPNCDTDGDIDIFDLLVVIDKALGRMNCCDYCSFGDIY